MIVAYFLLGETMTMQKLAGVVTVVVALCIYTVGDKFVKKNKDVTPEPAV